ncbi:ABC transporter ATP-binding protein [Bordetella bronchiseptica]|uniref:ABC transport ATP-binding subunit n=1 Tax=Bordetella bronchiseptica (strain ATCC BAA-588 / NCTC 13252 / RB50) TaxID=257310 RepID=A0A0H3LR71_BORBR|nr:ABC transporter ATP-binding protein [Bordetella bronchiseptica]KAK68131.1 oligopeptide/dipeptide transporter, C-terminal domain protein [Bordetella bronchiseptica 980-2]AUV49820.1 ABC transporter ATP-binding protein [Bordetella bronchiseptica]KCV51286.1 oligopeptide/dipeptide transporter, C-terminal domain protein [Bordetella bronchiseptica 3E44]KCV58918.1 oligopeptide/dipeptide transporter, C-terminal domain protein [Bordetella bronchiseptica 980]KDB84315.1 oligopeptide/dipeptide transport
MTMNDHETLLSVRDLTIALPRGGDREYAVRDVSYDIRAGEILCIVGESGSGKSMSANAIMGLLPDYLQPQGGQILFRGKDLLRQDEATLLSMRGKDMAMIFQEPLSALNPLMTVGEQIGEVMRVHDAYPGPQRQRRVLELLAFVGLPDPAVLCDVYPFRLSGGQRQRVMIAMALALEPALLIADEPTTALDVTTQAQILALIARIQKEKGMGVMFVTHDFGVVAEIAHRVAVMEQGILVEQGPAEEVLNRPQHPYTRRLIAAVPHRRADTRPPVAQDAPVLAVDKLCKTYVTGHGWFGKKRVVRAVDEVSFEVRRGETLGIVGESGSGKSTIGKCLLKLIGIDGGKLVFNGRDIAGLSESQFRPLRKDIQMIFQDPFASLNPRQTVGRIISDGPVANGKTRAQAEARARELLTLVGLDPSAFDRYPNQFSGGQRQRIGIARALALEPQVLVADESVSALDVSVQAQVLQLLHELQQRLRIALIFITHDLRVAAQICNAVLVMHRGKVVEYGTPAQIFDQPQNPYTQQLIAAVPGQHWDPTKAQTA